MPCLAAEKVSLLLHLSVRCPTASGKHRRQDPPSYEHSPKQFISMHSPSSPWRERGVSGLKIWWRFDRNTRRAQMVLPQRTPIKSSAPAAPWRVCTFTVAVFEAARHLKGCECQQRTWVSNDVTRAMIILFKKGPSMQLFVAAHQSLSRTPYGFYVSTFSTLCAQYGPSNLIMGYLIVIYGIVLLIFTL